jgi:hypothetical protein
METEWIVGPIAGKFKNRIPKTKTGFKMPGPFGVKVLIFGVLFDL